MKKEIELWKGIMSCFLIVALTVCCPLESLAQSVNSRSNLLEGGTSVVLSLDEAYKADNVAETGVIPSVIESDVYSADGSRTLIKAGTPAYIEFTAEHGGSWGKAGQICLTHATTKTIDNKNVSLRLSSCKKGGSKLAGVIVLSVLLFPFGLFSGFMKGGMPKLPQGTTFNGYVMQDVHVEAN